MPSQQLPRPAGYQIPLDQVKRAAVQRLIEHIGRMSLADYEQHRWAIERAEDEQAARGALRKATGEEIAL